MARVRFDSGPRAGAIFDLNSAKTVFGRHESCDCVLSHPTVSRHHFFIESVQGKHLIVDQGSGNGTFVNGTTVSWMALKHRDVIRAGPFALIFENSDAEMIPVSEELIPKADAGFSGEYPREYLLGIEHFNAGRYFEAHEIWEEIWLRSSDEAKVFFQMLIQAAVGLLHFERGNYKGARGMYRNVVEKVDTLPGVFMSLDVNGFDRQFREFFEPLKNSEWEKSPEGRRMEPIQLRSVSGKG